jgi:hypothetical protein
MISNMPSGVATQQQLLPRHASGSLLYDRRVLAAAKPN